MNLLKKVLKSKWLYVAILSVAGIAGASSETVMQAILALLGMN